MKNPDNTNGEKYDSLIIPNCKIPSNQAQNLHFTSLIGDSDPESALEPPKKVNGVANGPMLAITTQFIRVHGLPICKAWDLRNFPDPVSVLKGNMGAVGSVCFSTNPQFLVVAEPADFVHVCQKLAHNVAETTMPTYTVEFDHLKPTYINIFVAR
ncbi:WD40 repeat-containing protein [Artemisia annua]|uniref:WD40 repeat-containing protein n=1 Tax=Artemisia annua TaxID=35608 RepID=A0A2U1KWG6_ARTAN|nr:WD40 repeat-containing protein [Artemisia annua]